LRRKFDKLPEPKSYEAFDRLDDRLTYHSLENVEEMLRIAEDRGLFAIRLQAIDLSVKQQY